MAWRTVADGLTFPEGMRFHRGHLWLSDMYAGRVLRLDADGSAREVARLEDRVSGLGFLPDGDLLVVAMGGLRLVRVALGADGEPAGGPGAGVEYADLRGVAEFEANDMLVDAAGRAWVGNFGDDSAPPAPPRPATLACAHPDGRVEAAATGMWFANGIVAVDDGRTLLVAETRAVPARISAFDVSADGTLSGRRVFAETGWSMPDGMAVTDSGDVWFASPFTGEVVRLGPDGVECERLRTPAMPFSVAWGDGRLFVGMSPAWEPEVCLRELPGIVAEYVPD